MVFNPPRALKPICEQPPKAYHLADFDAYERVCGRRWAMYISSLACPYNCAYCTNAGVYGRKWNALEAEQVAEETTDLARRNRLSLIWMVDDNFLVDRDRALGIAEGLIRREAKFEWSIQASTNLVTRLTVDEWKILKRSGLAQVRMGADSGSPKMLKLMNKDFQKLETIYEAAETLHLAGVRPSFNMIFGYPGEGETERRESIRLIMDICRALSRGGVLDQHLHPISRRAGDEESFRARHPGAADVRRVGGFLPAVHGAALAQGPAARARADHARISADGVHPRARGYPSYRSLHALCARGAGRTRALALGSRRV